MNVNYTELIEKIKDTSVPKPLSGTLSGHAAGEPFDKHVYNEIKKQLPKNTFRQYEYLNDLYSKNAEIIGIKARQELFDSPSVLFLLNAHFVNLFQSIPENLYINWAAAMQVQFHVCNLDQNFKGTIEEWTKLYLKHFVAQVYRRSEYMVEKYAKPFEKYIH